MGEQYLHASERLDDVNGSSDEDVLAARFLNRINRLIATTSPFSTQIQCPQSFNHSSFFLCLAVPYASKISSLETFMSSSPAKINSEALITEYRGFLEFVIALLRRTYSFWSVDRIEERTSARSSGVDFLDVVIRGREDAKSIKPFPTAHCQCIVDPIIEGKAETLY